MAFEEQLAEIQACPFTQAGLRELAGRLPPEDERLAELIDAAARARDERAFRNLVFAGLGAGRVVDARHLTEGAALLEDVLQLCSVAGHCSGEVGPALLAAAKAGRMGWEREAMALVLAGFWYRDRREAQYPPALLAEARKLARSTPDQPLVQLMLGVLARVTQDEGVAALVEAVPEVGIDVEGDLRGWSEATPWSCVPASPPPRVLSGYTVRRAVARVGRNDPCPCGSGKKYKRCCFEKDQGRLLQSSAVPGVTLEEWREEPELGLTWQRLRQMRTYEVLKLDPRKVPESLQEHLLDRLLDCCELEAAVRCLEVRGSDLDDPFYWDWTAELVIKRGDRALMERLMALRSGLDASGVGLGVNLFLAGDEGAAQLLMVEKEARAGLGSDAEPGALVELACQLLASRAPALGLLVARGVLPLAHPLEGDRLLTEILDTRDTLGLSPDEPMEAVYDRLLEDQEAARGQDSEELARSRQALEEKGEEVRRLRAELIGLHRELEAREKQAARRAPAPTAPDLSPASAADDSALRDLRAKVRALKDLLKERHGERNQLRHELAEAREALSAVQAEPVKSAEPGEEQGGESLFLAAEDLGHQPLRLPEWPKKFGQQLAAFPRPVGRAAMVLVGRLAAGEPGAFAGVKRLRALPDVYRQRLAGHYRLLFRLRSDTIEILELVDRKDLERAIKARL